jgi:REP element-mobilizing transposase RayT
MDHLLGEGRSGPLYLLQPPLAQMITESIRYGSDVLKQYELHAFVVMPNHVHVSYEGLPAWPLEKVLHSWKSYTGTKCNAVLQKEGSFWHEEYFDRVIRDSRELQAVTRYIAENAIRAGLRDWKWVGVRGERVAALL